MIRNQLLEQVLNTLTSDSVKTIPQPLIAELKSLYPDNNPTWKNPLAFQKLLIEIGQQTDLLHEATLLAEDMQERLDILQHKLKFIPAEHRPKVLYLQDIDPLVANKSPYLDNLIQIAGGIPQSIEDQNPCNPNVLVIVSEKNMGDILAEIPNVFSTGIWKDMDAIKNNRIYIIHHPKYLRNGGLDIPEDAEILSEIINPGYFIFGRDEDAWMNFSIEF